MVLLSKFVSFVKKVDSHIFFPFKYAEKILDYETKDRTGFETFIIEELYKMTGRMHVDISFMSGICT
ncbi:MAG: hypothetical protein LBD76_02430 [Prevotellaceae bacterium]|nr:hypothetical protein [Prevotellaceae bacterium]